MKTRLKITIRLLAVTLTVPLMLVGCQEDLDLTARSFACERDADCLRGLICGPEGRCVSLNAEPTNQDVPDVTDPPETTEDTAGSCSDTCPEVGLVDCDLSTGESLRTCLEVEGCDAPVWSEPENGCVIGGQECVKSGSANPNNPCQDCRPEDFSKGYLSVADGAGCTGADQCMEGMACSSGVCQGGTPRTCDDDLGCTDDSCIPETGECLFALQEGFCKINDLCVAGDSVGETNACLTCDPSQSTSDWSPVTTETPCEDGDVCTEGDTCVEGTCSPGPATVCADDNPCTQDLCVPETGCDFPAEGPQTLCAEPFPHGQGLCDDTECTPNCDDGYESCDEDWENGCEANTSTDAANCGGCGDACVEGWFCLDGQCSNSCGDMIPCGNLCVDLATDPLHCGACDAEPCDSGGVGELAVCLDGACGKVSCEDDLWDANGDPTDGCEYSCVFAGVEVCDGVDNDCDGQKDEDFSLESDSEHCGACNQPCQDDSVISAACVESACAVVTCDDGLYDLDGKWETGCEYGCDVVGDETCNGDDDDCDGEIDEAYQCPSETSDTVGVCGENGECAVAPCELDTWNVDGDPSTGCEYECVKTSMDDIDGCGWGDEDCDGEDDEDGEDGESCPPSGNAVVGIYATDGGYAGTNCALRGDGSVWCWGNSWGGQLGNGNQQKDESTPQQVLKIVNPPQALSGIVTMDTNMNGSCAIDGDGQTHCWGATGYFGEGAQGGLWYIADGTILDSNGLTPLQGLVSLGQGSYGGCGVMDDGTARCWGTNVWGSLGNGTFGGDLSVSVVVLGADGEGPLTGVVKVAASYGHNFRESRCAILDDETLWCWGRNYEGQLGIGVSSVGYESEPLPVQVLGAYGGFLEGVKDVDCGYHFCCAAATSPFEAANTQAWCWGTGGSGQLGQGSLAGSPTPVAVVTNQLGDPLVGVTSISAGHNHACATTEDNEVFCWGSGQNGELADPDAGLRPWAEVIPGLEDAIGVTGSFLGTCAWTAQGEAFCWGWNSDGHLGLGFYGADKPVPHEVQGLTDTVDVEVGSEQVCARATDGTITCWGDNDYGQLGLGSTTARSTPDDPVQMADGTPVSLETLDVGGRFACGRSQGDDLLCWGSDQFGQLGDGFTGSPQNTPVVIPDSGALLSGFTSWDLGYVHACGLDADGGAWCWGDGNHGQLGNGETAGKSTPVPVLTEDGAALVGATSIFTGDYHSCALLGAAGDVWCWGYNDVGQVGDGATDDALTARPVKGSEEPGDTLSGIQQLGLGDDFSCGLTQGGQEVWCWGSDNEGQLGNGTLSTASSPFPIQVSLPQSLEISHLDAGYRHACVLSTTGKIFCWGEGSYGQQGSGTKANAQGPFVVPALGSKEVVDLSCGGNATCAVDVDAGVWCWGSNVHGQVGNGTTWVMEPTKVVGLDE